VADVLRPVAHDVNTGKIRLETEITKDGDDKRIVTGTPVVFATDDKFSVQYMVLTKVTDDGQSEKAKLTDRVKVDDKASLIVFDANPRARERIVVNASNSILYMKYGGGCSLDDFTTVLSAWGQYRVDSPDMYRGMITAVRATESGDIVRTER